MLKLPIGLRRRLRLPPVKDTTLRNALARLHPCELRSVLERLDKAAFRRGALPIESPKLPFAAVGEGASDFKELPFHAVSMDGKYICSQWWDHHYAQQHTDEKKGTAHGLIRVVNSVLATSQAKPVLDACPIPADTSEMGIFPDALMALVSKYGDSFRVVMYDAGAASESNMDTVVAAGKDFLFCLADKRWLLFQKVKRFLGRRKAKVLARTEDVESKAEQRAKVRELHMAYMPNGYRPKGHDKEWGHVRMLLRLHTTTVVKGKVVAEENHYFVSSLELTALNAKQWMTLIRTRWSVESAPQRTERKESDDDLTDCAKAA